MDYEKQVSSLTKAFRDEKRLRLLMEVSEHNCLWRNSLICVRSEFAHSVAKCIGRTNAHLGLSLPRPQHLPCHQPAEHRPRALTSLLTLPSQLSGQRVTLEVRQAKYELTTVTNHRHQTKRTCHRLNQLQYGKRAPSSCTSNTPEASERYISGSLVLQF